MATNYDLRGLVQTLWKKTKPVYKEGSAVLKQFNQRHSGRSFPGSFKNAATKATSDLIYVGHSIAFSGGWARWPPETPSNQHIYDSICMSVT